MRHAQLKAFHQVAETGGFSRAAEVLRLTQPAISEQVRRLEEEYDVLLFDRRRKQVVLTDAGRRLHEATRRLFDAEAQAFEILSEQRALTAGTLRIMADSALHMVHVLSPFRERYPGVRIEIRSGNTREVMEALQIWEADFGVLGEAPGGHGIEQMPLGTTPIVAFAADGTPWAKRGTIRLADLARLPLVLREKGSRTRAKFEAAAAGHGLSIEASIEAEGREAVREIVAAGAGIGLVSLAEFGHDPRLKAIPIEGAALEMSEALVWLSERSGGKLMRAFLEIAGADDAARKIRRLR